MNIDFLRASCKAAGVQAVRVSHGRNRGRYGFVRIYDRASGDFMERSGPTFADEQAALSAAHKHYRLRAA